MGVARMAGRALFKMNERCNKSGDFLGWLRVCFLAVAVYFSAVSVVARNVYWGINNASNTHLQLSRNGEGLSTTDILANTVWNSTAIGPSFVGNFSVGTVLTLWWRDFNGGFPTGPWFLGAEYTVPAGSGDIIAVNGSGQPWVIGVDTGARLEFRVVNRTQFEQYYEIDLLGVTDSPVLNFGAVGLGLVVGESATTPNIPAGGSSPTYFLEIAGSTNFAAALSGLEVQAGVWSPSTFAAHYDNPPDLPFYLLPTGTASVLTIQDGPFDINPTNAPVGGVYTNADVFNTNVVTGEAFARASEAQFGALIEGFQSMLKQQSSQGGVFDSILVVNQAAATNAFAALVQATNSNLRLASIDTNSASQVSRLGLIDTNLTGLGTNLSGVGAGIVNAISNLNSGADSLDAYTGVYSNALDSSSVFASFIATEKERWLGLGSVPTFDEPTNFVMTFGPGGRWTINTNPFLIPGVSEIVAWLRGLIAWVAVAWLYWQAFKECYKAMTFQAMYRATDVGAINSVVGGVAAVGKWVTWRTVSVALMAVIPTYLAVWVGENEGLWSFAASNPFVTSSSLVNGGLWMADKLIPISLVWSILITYFIFRLTLMLTAYVVSIATRLLPA